MNLSTNYLENIIITNLTLNSNSDTEETCYYKCANKNRLEQLYIQKNHEVIFGRRGTGKTTLLKSFTFFVNEIKNLKRDNLTSYAIYINMEDVVPDSKEIKTDDIDAYIIETHRKFLLLFLEKLYILIDTISNTNIYFDIVYTDTEINELLEEIIIFQGILENGCDNPTKTKTTNTNTKETEKTTRKVVNAGLKLSGSKKDKSVLSLALNTIRNSIDSLKERTVFVKEYSYILDNFQIRDIIQRIIDSLKLEKLFVCIDEFTFVDKGLDSSIQPFIAQMIKDTFFRNNKIVVKITSLWNRTEMQSREIEPIKRIGIELGEDIAKGMDLDVIFMDNEYASKFFKQLLVNIILIENNSQNHIESDYKKDKATFTSYIISQLMDSSTFEFLVCGSQGVPRIFGNILNNSIHVKRDENVPRITNQIVFNATIDHYKRETRRKINNDDPLVIQIEDYITDSKQRFILIPIDNYNKHKMKINNLVDKNYIHQIPSERIPRKVRNKYKFFLVHYGNYLESLGLKDFHQISKSELSIFPKIPNSILNKPEEYCMYIE